MAESVLGAERKAIKKGKDPCFHDNFILTAGDKQ
jgi:hypothetical protein